MFAPEDLLSGYMTVSKLARRVANVSMMMRTTRVLLKGKNGMEET